MSQQKSGSTRPKPRRATAQSPTPPSNTAKQQEHSSLQPAPDDREGWKTYWTERQQPWRTEPEISAARQNELEAHRSIIPDSEKGIYPFKDVKLSRADVEWLLITHENGRGPVYWNDGQHIERVELDLRGADLRHANLENLPLARMIGGLQHWSEWELATEEQRKAAGVHLEHAQLKSTHLESAKLRHAHLQAANLRYTHLTSAMLFQAHLEEASLYKAHLEDTNLREAHLEGANLCLAFLDRSTTLDEAILVNKRYGPASLLDVHWGEMNVAAVDWSQLAILGEEYKILKGLTQGKSEKEKVYREAVRANRQLAVVLQDQGLNEEAAHFAYRATVLQRKLLGFQIVQPKILPWRRVRKFGAWCFSHILNLLAGYGYRPARSFLAYLLIVFGFMGLYLLTSHFTTPHLSWDEALVLSLSSFHGRGFFTQTLTLGDPYARLAVAEAVLGLFVEVSLIATFTQRFFGK